MSMVSSNKLIVNFLAYSRRIVPKNIIVFLERMRLIPLYLKWSKDNKSGKNIFIQNNKHLKNKYKGKRCIIIGNGPSLNKIDLSLLKNEYTFGLNRIYLLFKKLGFQTTFLVSINRYVMKQFGDEMLDTDCVKFFNYKYKNYINHENANFISPSIYNMKDLENVERGFLPYSGSVSFLTIQLALYFGFSEIILIGFDNNFNNKGPSDKAIKSTSTDSDHFDKNYFGKGVVWQLPNYDALDYGWQSMENYFTKHSERNIINCTVGGNLENFTREEFSSQLQKSKFGNKIS